MCESVIDNFKKRPDANIATIRRYIEKDVRRETVLGSSNLCEYASLGNIYNFEISRFQIYKAIGDDNNNVSTIQFKKFDRYMKHPVHLPL